MNGGTKNPSVRRPKTPKKSPFSICMWLHPPYPTFKTPSHLDEKGSRSVSRVGVAMVDHPLKNRSIASDLSDFGFLGMKKPLERGCKWLVNLFNLHGFPIGLPCLPYHRGAILSNEKPNVIRSWYAPTVPGAMERTIRANLRNNRVIAYEKRFRRMFASQDVCLSRELSCLSATRRKLCDVIAGEVSAFHDVTSYCPCMWACCWWTA